MPSDTKKITNNSRPFTPKAPTRSKTGPYLAPKLATATRATPSLEARRDDNSGTLEIGTKAIDRNNIATPVKTFLATNVTPRSSSRKSRADSPNVTPNSTPGDASVSSRPGSMAVDEEDLKGQSIYDGSANKSKTAMSAVSVGTGLVLARKDVSLDSKGGMNPETDSPMFFHASDANSVSKRPAPPLTRTATGFVYADGRREDPTGNSAWIVGTRAKSQVGTQSRFYYANGKPRTSPVLRSSPATSSPVTSPKLPPLMTSPNEHLPKQRSNSPLKEFEVSGQQNDQTSRRASGASNLSLRSRTKSAASPPNVGTAISSLSKQTRQKTSPTGSRMHAKTQSLGSIGAHIRPQSSPTQPDSPLFALNSPQFVRDTIGSPSLLSLQTGQLGTFTSPSSPLVSPDRINQITSENKIDQLNAMASNARRERKVLDLEISNSSLLAINRTLEREMRKQKAELRRYRRLTSHGRLSLGPSGRVVSGATTISTLSLDSDRTFESEDEEDTLTDIPSESDSELDSSDDSALSLTPEAQAARDLRQRTRDEKRLQLDLSKHQQLLDDSQKMNESLKRCLGRTESLIIEGKKALEYQVRASELKLGGRVLNEDDDPTMRDVQPRLGLLSPTKTYPEDGDGLLWASPSGSVIHHSDDCNPTMADEGKEFREYLDGLVEPMQ